MNMLKGTTMKSYTSPLGVLLVLCLTCMAGLASASAVVTVSIGPDPFGSSATFDAWNSNALYALQNNLTAYGTPGTPEYYSQVAAVTPNDVIGTGFPSWRGGANPTGNYAGQTGNMVFFGLVVKDPGTFDINSISFTDNFFGDSATRYLTDIGGLASARMVAFYGGSQVNSGPVDELYFSGFGDQTYIAQLADLPGYLQGITNATTPVVSGVYAGTILGAGGGPFTASSNVEFLAPEPVTLTFCGIGLLVLGCLRRKR